MGKAPSVANFGERWPLACFALPSRYFDLLGGGDIRSGAEGSQFVEGRHLSPIPSEGGLQPIVCCQPARSGEGHFLAVSLDLLLAVSPGSFSDSVVRYLVSWFWSWLSWLCDQGIVQDSDRLLQSSPAAQRTGKDSFTTIFAKRTFSGAPTSQNRQQAFCCEVWRNINSVLLL